MLYARETEIKLKTHDTKEPEVRGEIIFRFFSFFSPSLFLFFLTCLSPLRIEFNFFFSTRHAPVEFCGQND